MNKQLRQTIIDSVPTNHEIYEVLHAAIKGSVRGYRRSRTKRNYDSLLGINRQIEELQARGMISQDEYDALQMSYVTRMSSRDREDLKGVSFAATRGMLQQGSVSAHYGLVNVLAMTEGRLGE